MNFDDVIPLSIVHRNSSHNIIRLFYPIVSQDFDHMYKQIKAGVICAAEEEDASDYDDDVACNVCGSRKSTAATPMILCDGKNQTCETAVHLKCVGLKQVPEGDWFCQVCQAHTPNP
jgi:hypothetical protein